MPYPYRSQTRPRKVSVTLADVPEEILERILALVLVQSAESSPRPAWHPYQTPPSAGHPTIISPLLVCRTWLRIATPVHYRHPVLRTPRHVELLLRALRHTPSLAPCVRSLHLHATSPALRDLVPLCTSLDTLDITVDNGGGHVITAATGVIPAGEGVQDRSVVEFCEAFTKTRSIRHLVIRKNAYLTQPNAIYVFEQLAKAIARWRKLETVNVAFRLSPSPAASALTQALSGAPRLHTLYTQLPAVWNTTLLDIAENPALVRIVLSPAPELAGAHLFLAEAKRHPRLIDLLRAGTPPPSPHPGAAFAAASSSRARAASAVIPNKQAVPMPTCGYEREVPTANCSSRRTAPNGRGAPGSFVGPSAYVYAPAPGGPSAAAYAAQGVQYAHVAPQQQHLHVASHHHPGQYFAYGPNQYQASAGARLAVPQPPYVAEQGPRRNGPGTRRMTAS